MGRLFRHRPSPCPVNKAVQAKEHIMSRKATLPDFALWAVLPMAQTSKIESRLTRILDKTRRRTLPRRALAFGIALGAAALVPLAMLRPVAKAQTASAVAGTVQLLGIQDIDIHHTDHRWWDAAGRILPGGVDAGAPSRTATDLFRSSNEHNLRFALHLPVAAEGDTVIFRPSGSFVWYPLATPHSGADRTLNASFPGALKRTTLSVGVAAGPWMETVDCPKTPGKLRMSRPSGEVLFTLLPNPRGQASVPEDAYGSRGMTPPPTARSSAVLVVSDHFHSPSPLPVDTMAIMISSYASTTGKTGSELQRILHDGENYERAVYGLDNSGKVLAKLTGASAASLEDEKNDRFVMEQLISIPKPLLKRIASFRLVARPYQWTMFKDVALQPVQ